MNKLEITHRLHNEISAIDAAIKQLVQAGPSQPHRQRLFDSSLTILINVKKEMQETLNDLNKDLNVNEQFTK